MSRLIAGVQPLILTQAGQRPTIPNPPTIMPDDNRFDKSTDLMVGQLAYNVVDDEWYYRGYSSIQTLLKPSTITVEQIEAWQSDKVYKAGNVFVSFVNPSSPDEQFQNEAIYRCKETTLAGQSPETHPEKWVYQGQSVTVDPTTVIETVTIETASSYNPTKEGGYAEGSIVSYKNESSPDPQFQKLELYLANSDIPQGVSPEDSAEWIFKGQEIVEQITYPTVRVKNSISTMQAIVNNMDGDITIIHTTGEIYEYDSEATSGVKPNNVLATDPGRWVLVVPHKVGEAPIDGNQYVRKDGEWVAPEVLQPTISTPTSWDGTLHNIDLSSNAYQTLTVNNGVTVVAIGVTFPADANEKMYEKVILIDNSKNNSAIASIVFDDNSGAYSWEWSVGDPINGIPAKGKAEIHLYNRSATVIKALTDVEA